MSCDCDKNNLGVGIGKALSLDFLMANLNNARLYPSDQIFGIKRRMKSLCVLGTMISALKILLRLAFA